MSNKLLGGVLAGSTSVSIPVVVRKTADNTGFTGKAAADITAYYTRQGAAPVALTAATDLAAMTSSFSAGGWKEADSANCPGLYRLDVDNAAFATGADWVVISVKVASAYTYYERFSLTTEVIQSGDNFALTGAIKAKTDFLPSATAGAAGGVLIAGSNAATTFATLTVSGATTLTGNVALAGGMTVTQSTLNGNGVSITGNGTGHGLNIVSGSGATGDAIHAFANSTNGNGLLANGNGTGNGASFGGGGTSGDGIHAAGGGTGVDIRGNLTGNLHGTLDALTTYTGNTPQTGDAYAESAAIKAKTDSLTFTAAGKVDANTLAVSGTAQTARDLGASVLVAGDFSVTMKTSIGTAVAASAVASVTGAVGSVTGMTAADVGAIKAKTDNLPSAPADESLIVAATDAIMTRLGAPVGASMSADIAGVPTAFLTQANGIETGLTFRDAQRLLVSATMAKCSGAATTTMHFRDFNDTKDRIVVTVDANGNRTGFATRDAT